MALGDEGQYEFAESLTGLFEKKQDLLLRFVAYHSKIHEADGHVIAIDRAEFKINGMAHWSTVNAEELAEVINKAVNFVYPVSVYQPIAKRFDDQAIQAVHFRVLKSHQNKTIQLPNDGLICTIATWEVQNLDKMRIEVTFREGEKKQWTIALAHEAINLSQDSRNRPTPYWPSVTPQLLQNRIQGLSGLKLPLSTLKRQILWIRTFRANPVVQFSFNVPTQKPAHSPTQQNQQSLQQTHKKVNDQADICDSIFQNIPENRQLEYLEFSEEDFMSNENVWKESSFII